MGPITQVHTAHPGAEPVEVLVARDQMQTRQYLTDPLNEDPSNVPTGNLSLLIHRLRQELELFDAQFGIDTREPAPLALALGCSPIACL